MKTRTISPHEFIRLHQQDPTLELFDVRTPVEYRAMHAGIARPLPLDQLDPRQLLAQRNGKDSEKPLYFICKTGSRAAKACEKLAADGFENTFSVEGGTDAWERAGLPVVRGKQSISLERQVRIAAGSLVLIGLILGVLVHPYLLALSAFVGAGLVVAGITDWCGMGLLLARMPWNQVRDGRDSGGVPAV
jgi:rhodanese-related sulfurtransferase